MPTERLATNNSRAAYYPRFSEQEYERRWEAVRRGMREQGLDALILYTKRGGPNIHYLTNILTIHTYLVFFADPDEPATAFVGHNNNAQFAREVSVIDDIRPMIPKPVDRVVDRINGSSAAGGAVGIVGLAPRYNISLSYGHFETFQRDLDAELKDATTLFTYQLQQKSQEELDWLERAGEHAERAMAALVEAAEPGVKEYELAAEMEYAYRSAGGRTGITYLTSAPMVDPEPGVCLPWREASEKAVEAGDVITNEFTAKYWGYGAQFHRPVFVGEEPTDRYREMYDIARDSYERMRSALEPGNTARDIYEGLEPIEDSEYKIYDVAVHGYGNVYGPPHIGTDGSDYWPGIDDEITADWELRENEVVVLQPNVVSADERYGLQYGNTLVVKDGGAEELVDYPTGITVV